MASTRNHDSLDTATTQSVCQHPWDRETVEPVKNMEVTEDMWDRFRKIYPDANKDLDYLRQVWDYFMVHIDEETRTKLDEKIMAGDFSGPQLWVLLYDYKGYIHLNQTASHVKTILKVYDHPAVRRYCEGRGLDMESLEVHDLSKVNVVEIVTYTLKFVHEACEFNDPLFQKGVQHHYDHNGHHPQYWGKDSMSSTTLLESILDMAGCHLERDLGSNPNALLSDVFDISSNFLARYTDDDRKMVEQHLTFLRAMYGTVWCDEV